MSLDFTLETTPLYNLLKISGHMLNDSVVDELQKTVYSESSEKGTKWIVDLSNITHMNSTGIQFIIKLLTKARINDGEVVLSGLNETVINVFKITKIDLIFNIFQTTSEAKNFFTKNL